MRHLHANGARTASSWLPFAPNPNPKSLGVSRGLRVTYGKPLLSPWDCWCRHLWLAWRTGERARDRDRLFLLPLDEVRFLLVSLQQKSTGKAWESKPNVICAPAWFKACLQLPGAHRDCGLQCTWRHSALPADKMRGKNTHFVLILLPS